uniref:Uncharacterized protein n=1 Tax=Caenorhabditis japonica TaxID=281687 RepID=A0A8R1E0J9_CAEJA
MQSTSTINEWRSLIVLATANPDDFSSCRDLPAEIKRHYDYVLPRFKNLVIPTGSLVMSDSYPLQDLYQKCPFKRRTFFACMHYEKLRNYISADTTSLEAISDNLNTFDLETCLQMNLEEDEDGKDCKNSVNSFLDLIRKEDRYMNLKVKKINDNSVWKCGANQFDTHVTQILTGHGCLWLKEAFNTCCKHQKECYQEFEDKERCDESWNSCNRAVITNYDNSIADECLPFYTWVENFQKLNNVFYYKQKRSYTIWSPDNDLIFWIGTSVLVIFMLIFLTILIIISKKCVDYNSEYKQCVGKELLVRAESSETIRSL